jgi:hypothetical protein
MNYYILRMARNGETKVSGITVQVQPPDDPVKFGKNYAEKQNARFISIEKYPA